MPPASAIAKPPRYGTNAYGLLSIDGLPSFAPGPAPRSGLRFASNAARLTITAGDAFPAGVEIRSPAAAPSGPSWLKPCGVIAPFWSST